MTDQVQPATHAIRERLEAVRARMAEAATRAGRDPQDVRLIAVSKTKPAEAVAAALQAGQTAFGENRVQEAAAKFPPLRARAPSVRLHLIGGLQTNKAREAVRIADMIHTLDRERLAAALAAAIEQEGRRPELLVEVNTGHEPQKAGIAPDEADAFIDRCRGRFGALLVGLMCIPPHDQDPRPHFDWLAAAAARHGLAELSMGMSSDFEAAIERGATMVRVGTAIFGGR